MRPLLTKVRIAGITHHRARGQGCVTCCRIFFMMSEEAALVWGWPVGRILYEHVVVDCMTCLVKEPEQ